MIWTALWLGWGAAALTIEGIALFNSAHGDTLSEHVWAWLGVRPREAGTPRVTPKWTLRVARLVMIFFLVWLILHFATGGWV